MILLHIIVAVEPEAGARVLQVFDMPVILIQGILDHSLIIQLASDTQQEKCRHKQRIRPSLLRKIICHGYRMLQHIVSEPQRMILEIIHLAHYNIPIFLVAGLFVQRDQHMAHGTGVDRPVRHAQLDIFIRPLDKHIQVIFISCSLIGSGYPIISHPARPVPRQVHS
ncbi:hypothetical protein D3C75_776770 [compost metagenome]